MKTILKLLILLTVYISARRLFLFIGCFIIRVPASAHVLCSFYSKKEYCGPYTMRRNEVHNISSQFIVISINCNFNFVAIHPNTPFSIIPVKLIKNRDIFAFYVISHYVLINVTENRTSWNMLSNIGSI